MRTYKRKLAEEVFERDQWCIYCGESEALTIAHVKNKGMGGTKRKDTADNLVILCMKCHHKCDNGAGGHVIRTFAEDYIRRVYQNE